MSETPERTDPYDLVFGGESIDERLFPPIAVEAETRDIPLERPDRFLFLSSVGKLLQAIAEPEPYGDRAGAGEDDAGVERPAAAEEPDRQALRHYGRLLFHAFHFWRERKRRLEVPEETVRWLLDEVTTVGDWRLRVPGPAGYVRLPRNLLWAAPGPGLQPEPADGFFWVHTEPADEPTELHLLLVLGVRGDRPGFSVVPASGVLDDEPHWADVTGREEGPDFETTLPGGELDRLYSVTTAAELLKLASLVFWQIDPASG